MSKYQEALDLIEGSTSPLEIKNGKITGNVLETMCREQINTLQELVDREKPKKVEYTNVGVNYCPKCGRSSLHNSKGNQMKYCGECGQALDWSK